MLKRNKKSKVAEKSLICLKWPKVFTNVHFLVSLLKKVPVTIWEENVKRLKFAPKKLLVNNYLCKKFLMPTFRTLSKKTMDYSDILYQKSLFLSLRSNCVNKIVLCTYFGLCYFVIVFHFVTLSLAWVTILWNEKKLKSTKTLLWDHFNESMLLQLEQST